MFRPQPTPPSKPDYCAQYTSPQYRLHTHGECQKGNYIKVWVPQNPYLDSQGYKQAVIYLHGFALGASEIYETHLLHLVKQGFYVFYPVYQHGFGQVQWTFWSNISEIGRAILHPCPVDAEKWVDNAISSVNRAYSCHGLLKEPVNSFLFGHSLGGLQALSWNYYATKCFDQIPPQLQPRQILAVDPIPQSDSNIPRPIRCLLKLFRLFKTTVDIKCTGPDLNVPVAILHGESDSIVKVQDWQKNFKYIGSEQKRLYLSSSDRHGSPSMLANHMQAATYTHFLPNWMAKLVLGGVGAEDNLNWRYVWFALDRVILGKKRADQLLFCLGKWSDGVRVKPIQILENINLV